MKDEKILITGMGSVIANAFAASLVGENEVWGVARFGDEAAREELEVAGITTRALDIGDGDFSELPSDFTYVLHLAYFRSPEPDFEEAFRVNGDGTGLILEHCRKAKAALYMSSQVIYSANEDPWFEHRESDPIGGSKPGYSATSVVSKVAGEAVAHFCSRALDLPVTIARLNTPYGPTGGMPVGSMESVVAGKASYARWDPEPYTPIHLDDMCNQLDAMLDAASTPANVVNWAGDEYVTVQDWCGYAAEWSGTEAEIIIRTPDFSARGSCAETTKRRSITGPCKIAFEDGFRQIFEDRHGAISS